MAVQVGPWQRASQRLFFGRIGVVVTIADAHGATNVSFQVHAPSSFLHLAFVAERADSQMALSFFATLQLGVTVVAATGPSRGSSDAAMQEVLEALRSLESSEGVVDAPDVSPVPGAAAALRNLLGGAQQSFRDAAAAQESQLEADFARRLGVAASQPVVFLHAPQHDYLEGSKVAVLSNNASTEVNAAFANVYGRYADEFDFDLYQRLSQEARKGAERFGASLVSRKFASSESGPHCDLGVAVSSVERVRGIAAFPGGVTGSVFGMDFGKRLFDLSVEANGPAGSGLVAPMALSSQALSTGMGLVQAGIAAVLHTVPPLVPPPAWNNQPLTCVPMVAGHNCFGSVTYPITMADFMVADVTDSMLDGYVASFPSTYARKVGKTDEAAYQACFTAYMGMMCASVFPRCTSPQSSDDVLPFGGSAPVCLHMCVLPLVMCPGFWLDDLLDRCSSVSVPPMCSQASFVNVWRLPPQIASFDESRPFAPECPKLSGTENEVLSLYDVRVLPASPIEVAARGGVV